LNLLATNQEQHRPNDRFRKVRLPPKYQPPRKEVALALPLNPWQRPIELDPFKYTKIMRKYRALKDLNYAGARSQAADENPGYLEAPLNFVGPYTFGSDTELVDIITEQQNHLVYIHKELVDAAALAPRPLIHKIIHLIDKVCRETVQRGGKQKPQEEDNTVVDNLPLESKHLQILRELSRQSWYDGVISYPNMITGIPSANPVTSKQRLMQFEKDVMSVIKEIPFWSPPLNQPLDHPFDQHAYDPLIQSMGDGSPAGWFIEPDPAVGAMADNQPTLLQYINTKRSQDPRAPAMLSMWSVAEATVYLNAMSVAHKI
jgi:hypothetical protein